MWKSSEELAAEKFEQGFTELASLTEPIEFLPDGLSTDEVNDMIEYMSENTFFVCAFAS